MGPCWEGRDLLSLGLSRPTPPLAAPCARAGTEVVILRGLLCEAECRAIEQLAAQMRWGHCARTSEHLATLPVRAVHFLVGCADA